MSSYEYINLAREESRSFGDWVDRGAYKVPAHLADLYDQGRASADALGAIADLFESTADYELALATEHSGVDRDPRLDETIFRLMDLESPAE